jgi:hypothetical protein
LLSYRQSEAADRVVVEADRVVVLASLVVALASLVVVEVERVVAAGRVAVEVGRASSGRRFSSAPFEVDRALSERLFLKRFLTSLVPAGGGDGSGGFTTPGAFTAPLVGRLLR